MVYRGFNDFRRGLTKARQAEVSGTQAQISIVKLDAFDFEACKTDFRRVKPDSFVTADLSSFQTVSWQGQVSDSKRHLFTHLVDKNNIHFASVVWEGGSNSHGHTRTVSEAVHRLDDKAFETILRSRGQDFSVAHALLRGPGQAHAFNQAGQHTIFYSKGFVDNQAAWARFLADTDSVRKNVTRLYGCCFPVQAQEAIHIRRNNPLLAGAAPSGGFLWGSHTSIAINAETQHTTLSPHRDAKDLSAMLCGVMPFGAFDPAQQDSGALHLFEAKVKLHIRPGDFCFFPSALLTHGNAPLFAGHSRGSLVAWTDADLLRFIKSGMQIHGAASEQDKQLWEKFQT